METFYIRKEDFAQDDGCGRAHEVTLRSALIAPDAALAFPDVLHECGFDDDFAVVYDENTYEALRGKRPKTKQEIVLPAAGLHANERGVALAEERLRGAPRLLVAAGAGTVHDITRYVCHARGIAFAGIPTAASVDGFVSSVAAMTLNGYKVTVPSATPVFLVADTDVIAAAPAYLAASGLGDVLGKYVSLTDWRIGRLLTDEYFCERTAALTADAVDEACAASEGVAAGERSAFALLMRALLLSGVAMQLTGNSRPASGAEHHVSHLIELGTPWLPETDSLHGEKVGVGTLLALDEYRAWLGRAPEELISAVRSWRPYTHEQLEPVFGALTDGVLSENRDCCLARVDADAIAARWDALQALLRALPEAGKIRAVLARVGGKTSLEDLGVPETARERILCWSPAVRNRLTFMRLLHALRLAQAD